MSALPSSASRLHLSVLISAYMRFRSAQPHVEETTEAAAPVEKATPETEDEPSDELAFDASDVLAVSPNSPSARIDKGTHPSSDPLLLVPSPRSRLRSPPLLLLRPPRSPSPTRAPSLRSLPPPSPDRSDPPPHLTRQSPHRPRRSAARPILRS